MQAYQALERKLHEVEEILNESYCHHEEEIEKLENHYHSYYRQWMLYLRERFNLLLYGVGSKTSVINEFCLTVLKDCCVLTVQGYNPKLSLRDVLRWLIVDVFGKATCPQNIDQAVLTLKNLLKSSKFPIFLIIYNIDGVGLRALKRQETLSQLADMPKLHLIATVDHNKSPLLWGEKMLSKFNFIWIDVTTYRHYLHETWNKQVLKTETSEADDHEIRVFAKIYYCCSDKIKKIVRIIIEDRLKNERHEQLGLNLQKLHARAQEEMLLSHQNLKSLDQLLKDFYEHGVMKKIASNCLVLTVDKDALTEFYESEFATDSK